jgi:hypothetical protein
LGTDGGQQPAGNTLDLSNSNAVAKSSEQGKRNSILVFMGLQTVKCLKFLATLDGEARKCSRNKIFTEQRSGELDRSAPKQSCFEFTPFLSTHLSPPVNPISHL